MKMQIKDFALLCGISVRTLHYYDEIGLLKPAQTDENTSYRYYNSSSLLRMQEILFYRELGFSLKSIKEILSSPDYSKKEALRQQKKLLMLKKERLERLISAIDGAEKGEYIMKAFDNSEFEKYKSEAEERWGSTDSYKEYSEKSSNYTKEKYDSLAKGMNDIFSQFALSMKKGAAPDSDKVQDLVKNLQSHITENYYNCTKEILADLGQMYVFDERFKNNIDKCGEGTAEFVSNAIKVYCR